MSDMSKNLKGSAQDISKVGKSPCPGLKEPQIFFPSQNQEIWSSWILMHRAFILILEDIFRMDVWISGCEWRSWMLFSHRNLLHLKIGSLKNLWKKNNIGFSLENCTTQFCARKWSKWPLSKKRQLKRCISVTRNQPQGHGGTLGRLPHPAAENNQKV